MSDYPPPDGCRWEWKPDDRWRVEHERTCARRIAAAGGPRTCGEPAVAALNRGQFRASRGYVDAWWPYCADHLYGQRIEDGVVLVRVAVRIEEPS